MSRVLTYCYSTLHTTLSALPLASRRSTRLGPTLSVSTVVCGLSYPPGCGLHDMYGTRRLHLTAHVVNYLALAPGGCPVNRPNTLRGTIGHSGHRGRRRRRGRARLCMLLAFMRQRSRRAPRLARLRAQLRCPRRQADRRRRACAIPKLVRGRVFRVRPHV